MKRYYAFAYLMFFLVFFHQTVVSQQLVSTASCNSVNMDGSFTWSIGEVIISEIADNHFSISNGYQQSYPDLLTQFNPISTLGVHVKVSPNPVVNLLIFTINTQSLDYFTYKLCDLSGNQLLVGTVDNFQTQLNVSNLPSAIYLLKILKNKELIINTKFIKN